MRPQYSRMSRIIVLSVILALPAGTNALDFGGVGVGTQVTVVDGETGSTSGVGFDLRTRFLWLLGLEWSATTLESSEAVWGATPHRVSLLVHAVQTEYFHLYLSPGLSGDSLGDAFDPTGDSTWYRLGGGIEFRIFEGLRIGGEIHWTLPSERVTERYLDENGEALLEAYLEELGPGAVPPRSVADVTSQLSNAQLLDLLPLDRLEFTLGLRYYFF